MVEFNEIKFKGQIEDYTILKAGLKRSDLNNKKLQLIFDAIDATNENGLKDGVLDENETKTFMQKIVEFAKGGRDKNFSSKEAKKFLQALGFTDLTDTDLFELLNTFSTLSKNIKQAAKNNQNNSTVIEYEDGHTEEIFQDGSKIITIKNGNKIIVKKEDKDGNLTEETVSEDGIEVKTEFQNGQKTKEMKTTSNTKEIVNYKDNKPTNKTISFNNGVIEEYNYENEEFVLKKLINPANNEEIIFDGTREINTRQDNGSKTVTVSDNGTPLSKTETHTNENNQIEEKRTIYEGDNLTETLTVDDKEKYQKKIIDGKEYYVEYDEKGNTVGIIVQNGESLSAIAKKFGCSIEDLIRVNASKIRGKYPNAYFNVGEEIKIPRKLEADEPALQNRKSREEAIGDYTRHQAKIREQQRIKAEKEAKELEELGLINRNGEGQKITIEGKTYTLVGQAIGNRRIAKDSNGNLVVISHDNKILDNDYVKQKVKETRNSQANSSSGANEPEPTQDEINIQKESAKQIVEDLKKAISGWNDHDAIKKALARIDNPIEFKEVEKLLAAEGYKANDLYSSVESFINRELQRVESDFSCEELETLVQKWIDNGVLKGEAAISAQARLAARVICDGGDGLGTDCDLIRKGIYMIKAPNGQDKEAAKKVYDEVNKIIANHNTFYGIGTKCKDLLDYLEGEMWDSEIKYLKGILAENDAVQGAEKVEAVTDLVDEAVSGAGTDIDALKQAIKAIKTPEERIAIEKKLKEYCDKNCIKPQIEGQSYLQAIMYDECDTFMGLNKDHKEIRKFNEMLIKQGAYTEDEIIKIRAEQAVLQLLEGDFDNIKDSILQIKDKAVLDKLNQLLQTKGYNDLNDFLSKKLDSTKSDVINAELASNKLLDDNTSADIAFRLIQNKDFDTRAMGLKAIRNEKVARLVDQKLKEIGSSLNKVYEQFNKEKEEYKSKAAIWDGLAFILGDLAEHISDEYRENTDVSDNIYVESDTAIEISSEQKQAYAMTIKTFEEKLDEMKKAYQEALESQGIVSDAVNSFCERYNLGTTRDEIEARIEHDTETLRLLKLAAEGKLSKIVDGKPVAVTFEEVFKERQSERVTANGATSAVSEIVKPKETTEFNAEKVALVATQAERMGAMNCVKNIVSVCWQDLESGLNSNDTKRLAVGIFNTLQKLSELKGELLSLEQYGYSLNSDGIIVDTNGQPISVSKLKEIAEQLKKGLADIVKDLFGINISNGSNADSVKEILDKAYDEKIEAFKKEYKEAFGQEASDEMIENYISTINTGKTVLNFGAMIGAAILAPFTGGGSLAVFVAVAGTSMALNAAEKSTDADGYTNLEWTSDAEQALWDGALSAVGMKIGMYADKFAKGALEVKAAQSLLAKNKSILSKLIKNPSTLEKATVWVSRVEAAGFEISSDTLQSLVQMYCQEGKFDEQAFLQGLIMSVAGNAAGHIAGARSDIKEQPSLDASRQIEGGNNKPREIGSGNGDVPVKPNDADIPNNSTPKSDSNPKSASNPKAYSEMNNTELMSEYQKLKATVEDSTLDTKTRAEAVKKIKDIEKTLDKRGFKIEGEELKQKISKKEQIKAEAAKVKEKYGKKIANSYKAILKAIESMKTKADFDKLATRIREKFVEYKALADELMIKLKAKAKDLKLKISETIDDIKAKSKTNNIDPQYRRTSDEFIPDELVRNAGNNGKPINENYIQASKDLREHYNQAIANGTYADSYENYVQTITQGHKVAYGGFDGKHTWYDEVGEGGINVNPGRIRGEGSMSSNRVEMGQNVESIAKKYGDKYSTNEISKVKLAGIPDEACPMNLYTQHFYPDGKYMSAYFEQMQRTAKEALELIENGASQDKILAKLAEHYQYAANARPFGQINNSLFMNEINTLLQKAGMKPMPHGILDHVAQRLQPDAFKKYFIDEYKKTALDTPNKMRSSGNDNIGGAHHNNSQSVHREPTNSPQFMNKGISFKIDIDTKISLANGVYVFDFSEPSVRNKLNSLQEGESLLVGRTVTGQKDIKIANQYVSGQHLKITKTKDGFIVEDLGSKNGSSIYKTKSAYQNQGANKSQQHNMSNPIEQSREFNRTHNVGCDEKIADGYKDGGRSARISDDGSVQSSREIIVVDRTRDIALQKMIQEVKVKTANMTPKQKAAFLQSYVHQKCGDGSIACKNLNAWEDSFRNKEVLLGDIINANPPVAVCRHRSLLSKILGDEIGLHIELQRGNFYNNNGQGGGHAWNVVKFEDGTSAIYDAMHNKTSNTTPGAVDDYAKQYYTTRNEDLYSRGISH